MNLRAFLAKTNFLESTSSASSLR